MQRIWCLCPRNFENDIKSPLICLELFKSGIYETTKQLNSININKLITGCLVLPHSHRHLRVLHFKSSFQNNLMMLYMKLRFFYSYIGVKNNLFTVTCCQFKKLGLSKWVCRCDRAEETFHPNSVGGDVTDPCNFQSWNWRYARRMCWVAAPGVRGSASGQTIDLAVIWWYLLNRCSWRLVLISP